MPVPEPRAWQGRVYRHIPAGSPFEPLDTHLAARSRENRWNREGEPTMVFASSRDVLTAELAQHLRRDRAAELASLLQERRLVAVELELDRVFDLTDRSVAAELGIEDAPSCFGDRALARATAAFLRHVRGADGIVVPSLAFPDDPACWNLVVFLDRLSQTLAERVRTVEPAGTFHPEPVAGT